VTTAALRSRWVKPTARGLRVVIPARFNPFIRTLLACWLAFWAATEIYIALGWLGVIGARIPSTPLWIAFVAGFTAAGAFLAFHLAWVLYGREILTLKDDVLTVSRGIGRWTGHRRNYPWREIRDLRVGSFERRVIYPEWGRLFVGKGDAYLGFNCRGRAHAIGRGLTKEEALDLRQLLIGEGASEDSRR
jgi:hypothetical protein